MYVDLVRPRPVANIADRESVARTRPHASVEVLLFHMLQSQCQPQCVHLFNKKVCMPVCSRGLAAVVIYPISHEEDILFIGEGRFKGLPRRVQENAMPAREAPVIHGKFISS